MRIAERDTKDITPNSKGDVYFYPSHSWTASNVAFLAFIFSLRSHPWTLNLLCRTRSQLSLTPRMTHCNNLEMPHSQQPSQKNPTAKHNRLSSELKTSDPSAENWPNAAAGGGLAGRLAHGDAGLAEVDIAGELVALPEQALACQGGGGARGSGGHGWNSKNPLQLITTTSASERGVDGLREWEREPGWGRGSYRRGQWRGESEGEDVAAPEWWRGRPWIGYVDGAAPTSPLCFQLTTATWAPSWHYNYITGWSPKSR